MLEALRGYSEGLKWKFGSLMVLWRLGTQRILKHNILLELGSDVHYWMQGSREVKNEQIDPEASKGVKNVLKENTYDPLMNHHDPQDTSNNTFCSRLPLVPGLHRTLQEPNIT